MRSNRPPRRRGAFTLIEVMLVLVILVIMASLVVTALGPMQRKARIDAAKSQIGLFKVPLDYFQLLTNSYPTTAQGLDALIAPPSDVAAADEQNWPILDSEEVPEDPWGNPYQYASPGSHNSATYDVWSSGPDGIDGNADDVGNWKSE